MLTSIIERVTTIASKHFIVAAFIPVLVFASVNATILYIEFDWFRSWADPQIATARAFDAAAVLIGLTIAANVVWSLSGFLRSALEGKHLPAGSLLEQSLRAAQLSRFRSLRERHGLFRYEQARICRSRAEWVKTLSAAAEEGKKNHKGQNTYSGDRGPAAKALADLLVARLRADAPSSGQLGQSVEALAEVLSKNDITAENPATGEQTLSVARRDLLTLIDYAEDEWAAREVAAAYELQSRFGSGTVAPTTLGNVAESIQYYGLTRYRLNLSTFWSRFQPILLAKQDFYGMVQDSKAQLDFFIASAWLSAATTLLWVILLPIYSDSVVAFLLVALLGPLVARTCYVSAVESYVTFGDTVRTAIDLYRFELLDALHLPRPNGLRDERVLWDALQRIASFGQEWVDLSYRQSDEKQT